MSLPVRRRAAAVLTALALGVLSACGTTEVPESAEGAPSAAALSDSCAADTTATATGPVTVTDHLGRTVELDQPAERVAVLEWQQTEDLLSLCVAPVAVADVDGFTTWDTAETLPEGTADVGTRQEPTLDALAAADPDLIIVEASGADDPVVEQLESLGVPVLATRGADASDPLGHMRDLFGLIAETTGRTERAEVVLAELDQHLAEARDEIAAADLPTTDFVYFDGWVEGGNVTLRPFGEGALYSAIGEELGLTPAWTGEVDPVYGLGQTDIEGLIGVGEATFFYTGTDDPAGSYLEELEDNAIWTSLPAVEEGRAHAFPAGIWTFGGPRSAQQAIDAYVTALTDA
ncbi:iron-siderophore ABC transporter substrate-binding protein [Brachybacterium saurashtrense]|uniref:Iron-siderophore ABC transporter substrate-binding protein n=1 Tax=Brachybacterium saurashtrense TaxID=556288 RepID=A0A345YK30_9MICO|nr:iron-siderophore ABC transporter substrate-binding protein [Brachybacterium saurashtrense]AXK44282.1 iron-siderophore ABC transporter substrate-binding protein [Brachybacterium saurashtrense]RRR21318.1 iron-siderophore ABC transporter substrate-binding protein [Brachybacterium saurashtrense]RRR22893.1 iron-siderophore ABC transporter substrate-binding protein [Brachybacterium saurashtrense]